jgi:hypothetical protein
MRSLRYVSLLVLLLGSAIASPIATVIGEDNDDIVINVYGHHRIVINEIAETAACPGSGTSNPHRLDAGPGASAQGPQAPRPDVSAVPVITEDTDSTGGSTGVASGGKPAGLSPANQQSPPASQPTVLVPACDPALDRSSLGHLLLNSKQDFYYAHNGVGIGSGTAATVKVPELVYPAVQLQVSSAIQRVTCTPTSAQIQFGDQAAYDTAFENWSNAGTFILVAYGEGCGSGHAAGEQDYLVVTSIKGDGSTTITAVISITDFEGAVGRQTVITIDIGIFNPTSSTDGFIVVPGSTNNPTNGTADSLPSGFDNFDEQLDNLIGFVSIDEPDFDAQFFPRPPISTNRHRRGSNRGANVSIEKRGFFDKIGSFFSSVSSTQYDLMKDADRHHYRWQRRRMSWLQLHYPRLRK